MMKFIGRRKELRYLQEELNKETRSLISIIGRRGIGKSRLVNEFKKRFLNQEDHFLLEFKGNKNLNKSQQIQNAINELRIAFNNQSLKDVNNWNLFFRSLLNELNFINKKIVLIIDEFAWLHNRNSGFVDEFASFYDRLMDKDILIIITGSAVSWMNKNVIKTSGGLHHKSHQTLKVKSFSLLETKEYLKEIADYSFFDVLDYYFFTGGVVRYLEKIHPQRTKMENVKAIYSNNDNVLGDEFSELFFSIFEGKNLLHKKIVEQFKVGNNKTISQLSKETGYSYNAVNQAVEELIVSDILSVKQNYGKEKKDKSYFLTDLFCYFYIKVFNQKIIDYQLLESNVVKGFAFEVAVMLNIDLFKNEIGRSGFETKEYSWRNNKAQIDLILDYGRESFSLIEVKYHNETLNVDEKITDNLLNKRNEFLKSIRKTKKEMDIIMISLLGTKNKDGRVNYIDLSLKSILDN